jgi:parallel beta-helix repeat protein
MVNCQRGVEIGGVSSNVTIMSVNISSPVGMGVYFYGTISNLTVSGTDSNPTVISNSGSYGIYNHAYSSINGLDIDHTLISNSLSDAISLYVIYAMNNVNIWNTTVIGARGNGINVNMAASPLSGNITLLNNTVSDCMGNGFYLNTRGNTSIMGNSITGNGGYGVYLIGSNEPVVMFINNTIGRNNNGLYLQSINNGVFQDNQLINNTGNDLYATTDTNNSFNCLTLGLLHPTIVSFDYVNGIIIKSVESTIADSSKWYNIGKYINITGLGSTVCDLKVYYTNSDLVPVEEATLKMFMYDGTAWDELSQSGVNTTEKYVYANDLNSFNTFAPLGTDTKPPTVNVDLTNGTYNTYKNVHLLASDNIDPQSVIYYMINEGIWNHQTTPVILNLNVDGIYNLEFYTTDFTGNQSPHQNRTYTIDTTSPTASSNIIGGLYNINQNIILTMTENGKIYYTTNGTIPTTSSTEYTNPITIATTIVLKFYAVDLASNPSPIYTETYTIDKMAPTVSANIIGGYYNTNKNVTLTMNKEGSIYYTLNGTIPTNQSNLYSDSTPLNINDTTILKFMAVDLAGNISPINTETYTIDKMAPTVSANIIGGYYNTNKNVMLTMNKEGSIYYTLNGTIPTNQSNLYSDSTPLNINDTTILKFMAVDLAGNISPIYTETYNIDKMAPTASATLPSGLYNVNKVVTLNMSEIGTIYYTLDGTTPTTYSTIYTKPISITKTTVLRYLVVDLAKNLSKSYTQTYTLDKIAPKIKSTTPTNMKTKYNKTSAIVIKFTENIKASTAYKYITIKNLTTKKYIKITKTLKNNTLTIKTGTRNKNTWYTITIRKASIQDNASNKLAATYTFKFKSI